MEKLEFKAFFYAIGDYSRFSILSSLSKRGLNVSEIALETGIEQSNVSHHMKCLLNCGFVRVMRNGKEHVYSINSEIIPIITSIIRHIEKYKKEIISCDIADMNYISRMIK